MNEKEKKEEIEEDEKYWEETATKFFNEGKYLEALNAYEKLARLDTKNADAWKGMATMFSLLDKPYEALESLEKAIKIDPADAEALEIKSLILNKLLEDNEKELHRLQASSGSTEPKE